MYSDADLMNNALRHTGSSYSVPQPVDSSRAANFARQSIAQDQAAQKESTDKLWGLVNVAANMYTGGAFGAVTGGVNSDGIANVNRMQGKGGGGAEAALLGAANGILGKGGQGGGQMGDLSWSGGPVKAGAYDQYGMGSRMGPIVGSVPSNPY